MKCGRGLPTPRHSYGGHRVQLWRASDWRENDKERLKVKQSRQSGVPRLYLAKIRYNALWTNGRAWRVHFLLDFRT